MNGYHYVYTLQSINFPDQHYTGRTDNLQRRLTEHNIGKVPHTSKSVSYTHLTLPTIYSV